MVGNGVSLLAGGPQPAVLQEVSIPIWSNTDCRLKYGPAAPGGIVEHMLCAGQASRDSCSVSNWKNAFLFGPETDQD